MNKILKNILIVAVLIVGGFLILKYVRPFGFGAWQAYEVFEKSVIWPVKYLFEKVLFAPYIYIALAITLLLEHFMPANPKQKIFSPSFVQDFVWFFYETMLDAIVITIYIGGLRWVYNTYFSFLTIQSVAEWPYWVRFALGVLLLDFLYWCQHFLNHKVPWLWELHTVHHSQKEINFFTDFRYHIFEYIIRHTILVIPFLIFAIHTPTVVVYSIIVTWYSRFYHGNIRTNLGPLKYILVTPQSHRVHHSKLVQHHDQNFGSIFCFWDRIFKTQYEGYDEYPETGVNDEDFPHEHVIHPFKALFLPIKQMAYPIIKVARKFRKSPPNK